MLLGEIIAVALGAVAANKMRSFLTTLGIIIGIGSVITMVSLGEGAQMRVQNQLAAMGANVLTVRPGQNMFGGIDRGEGGVRLTTKAAEALMVSPQYIRAVSPEMERRQQTVFGGGNASLSIMGVWPSYPGVQNFTVEYGRMFTDGEDRGRRTLAVLGARVGEKLGVPVTSSLIGQRISIRGIPFEVIGVMKEKGAQGFSNPDEVIYIPLATAQFRVFGSEAVRSIAVQVTSEKNMDKALGEIDRVLRREMRVRPGEASNFNVRDQKSLLTTVEESTKTFTTLLAGISLISLLVGGIGIMNIMLVSVTERTREIGIRKALGAKKRDILLQFLLEALVLCAAGGLLGCMLGIGASKMFEANAGWVIAIKPQAVLIAFGFSAIVGVFFGIWPARRAASLDPIVSLRYE
jgi:putative ABC transport system permease protein